RRRHTRWPRDWSSDVCSSDLPDREQAILSSAGDFAAWRPVRNQDGSQQDTVTVVYFFHKRTPGLPHGRQSLMLLGGELLKDGPRSEERRVGKECRSRWWL